MKIATLALTVGIVCSGLQYSFDAIAAETILISKQVSETRSTTLVANANTPMREIKAQAKVQLIHETLDVLPTYIMSTQTIVNNEYTEKMQFVAAALIEVSSEKYDINYDGDLITLTMTAMVRFDTNEINRKIKQIESDTNRNNMMHDSLTKELKLNSQVDQINKLYKSNVSGSSFKAAQDYRALNSELVNIPLGDMVAEFELMEKFKKAEAELKRVKSINNEWLNLNEYERAEFEANVALGNIINTAYMDQIYRPLTLEVTGVENDIVIVSVRPLAGLPYMMPWSIARHERIGPYSEKLAGGVHNMHFLDFNCITGKDPRETKHAWLKMLEKGRYVDLIRHEISYMSVDGKMHESSNGLNLTLEHSDLKVKSEEDHRYNDPRQGLYVPGYNTPIFHSPKLIETMGKDTFISQPIGITWDKTKAEIDALGSEKAEPFLQKSKTNVPVWGIKLTLNGQTQTKPWIVRHEEIPNSRGNSNYKPYSWRASINTGGTSFSNKTKSCLSLDTLDDCPTNEEYKVFKQASEIKTFINESIEVSSQVKPKFSYINPIRTTPVKCGVPVNTSYPEFKLTRLEARNLTNADITVFRY